MLEVIYYVSHKDRVAALKNAHICLANGGLLFLSTNLGRDYFEEEEFKKFITDAHFEIESTHLVYGNVYWKFEKYPLNWYIRLRSYELKTGRSHFFTQVPIKLIKFVLGSFRVFSLGMHISKLMGEKPCLMYVIARKK